jgi:hypothetical protein
LEAQKVGVPLDKLTEAYLTDDAEDGQSIEEVGITMFDQTAGIPLQPYVPLHQSAEDVTIVVAASGSEDTDWIRDFCYE